MEFTMTQEESYADRRKLFKNIWDTAMTLEDKDANEVISKPKVIKTLRLDEVDRFPVGKKKKQRLRNLRAVCNKLLDFCDRQDADDLFYEQMAADGKEAPPRQVETQIPSQKPKAKVKKKVVNSKSVFSRVTNSATPKATASERQGDFKGNESRHHSPTKTRRSITFKTKLSNDHNLENVPEERVKRGLKVKRGKGKKRTLTKPINVTPGISEEFY